MFSAQAIDPVHTAPLHDGQCGQLYETVHTASRRKVGVRSGGDHRQLRTAGALKRSGQLNDTAYARALALRPLAYTFVPRLGLSRSGGRMGGLRPSAQAGGLDPVETETGLLAHRTSIVETNLADVIQQELRD
jgi:hypothetical protein